MFLTKMSRTITMSATSELKNSSPWKKILRFFGKKSTQILNAPITKTQIYFGERKSDFYVEKDKKFLKKMKDNFIRTSKLFLII